MDNQHRALLAPEHFCFKQTYLWRSIREIETLAGGLVYVRRLIRVEKPVDAERMCFWLSHGMRSVSCAVQRRESALLKSSPARLDWVGRRDRLTDIVTRSSVAEGGGGERHWRK